MKTGRPAPEFISSEVYYDDGEPMDIHTTVRLSDLRVSFYVFHYNFMREIEFTADEIVRVIEEPVKGGTITPRTWTSEGWPNESAGWSLKRIKYGRHTGRLDGIADGYEQQEDGTWLHDDDDDDE